MAINQTIIVIDQLIDRIDKKLAEEVEKKRTASTLTHYYGLDVTPRSVDEDMFFASIVLKHLSKRSNIKQIIIPSYE